jgi:hypothetical protein
MAARRRVDDRSGTSEPTGRRNLDVRRWHSERELMLRRWREHEWTYFDRREPPSSTELGRFRKQDPHDCGVTRCGCPHPEKFYAPKRRASRQRAAIAFELDAYA